MAAATSAARHVLNHCAPRSMPKARRFLSACLRRCRCKLSRRQVSRADVAFSNRPFEVKHFQTIHHRSVDVAHGLALLFGIGTKALPAWDSKTRRNNLMSGVAIKRQVQGDMRTHLIRRPVRDIFPPQGGARVPIGFDPAPLSCCRGFPGPAKLCAVNPDAVHDHSEPAGQRHDRLFHPAAPGNLHRPGLEP